QAGASYREIPVLPHENVGHWLRKAATRHRELRPDEIGVVLVPHGADFNWNETMRAGIEPLRDEYMTEDAFSMVDPVVVERAVRRLEARGAKAAVVVRIFSLESSFREKAEYILGLRRDYDHFPTRIRSPLEFHTLGGMEATPHLAAGLADRVRTLSEDPSRETVILLGHGAGPDSANAHWIDNLHRIADGVEERTNGEFRDYRVHTWREDWPEKRDASVTEIRRLVRDASEGDGIALVVPQRTVGQGPAREYLDGLDYRYGEGLAPHPEFTAWLRATIEQGIEAVADSGPPSATVPD
ncbi:MAG: cobalamin biosynthesis protein CbiX, partial [Gemmatimonadota bacterium]